MPNTYFSNFDANQAFIVFYSLSMVAYTPRSGKPAISATLKPIQKEPQKSIYP